MFRAVAFRDVRGLTEDDISSLIDEFDLVPSEDPKHGGFVSQEVVGKFDLPKISVWSGGTYERTEAVYTSHHYPQGSDDKMKDDLEHVSRAYFDAAKAIAPKALVYFDKELKRWYNSIVIPQVWFNQPKSELPTKDAGIFKPFTLIDGYNIQPKQADLNGHSLEL